MSKVLGLIVTVDESEMTALDLKTTQATVTVLPFKPQYPHTNSPHWTPYNHFMNCLKSLIKIACEQALRGALAAGRKNEGEFATTSLEFEYRHRKSRVKKLIGGDDISNDVITLGTCFSMFVYIRARFRFALIGRNLTAQSKGSHRGIRGGIQIPET